MMYSDAVEKDLFNHKVHKGGSKGKKLKPYNIDLCDLCENAYAAVWLLR
jgi:hypothetical protein